MAIAQPKWAISQHISPSLEFTRGGGAEPRLAFVNFAAWLNACLHLSRMVRRPDEVCVKDLFAAWSCAATRGLDGDEHGVNVGQYIRVVHRQNPPARRFVVNREEA